MSVTCYINETYSDVTAECFLLTSRVSGMMTLPVHILPTMSVTSTPTSWWGLAPQGVVESCRSPLRLAEDMADQLEDLLVAISWLSHAGQGGGGQALRPLLLHQLVFPLFGF